MNNLQHILQVVFRKESLDQVSVEELEEVSNQHPLFAPLHFLLAKKYKQTGNELYEKQIRKTALHFHNPLWLHYQLGHPKFNHDSAGSYESKAAPSPAPAAADNTSHDMIEEVVVHQEQTTSTTFEESSSPVSENAFTVQAETTVDDAHVGEMYHTNAESEALKIEESAAKEDIRSENDQISSDPQIEKTAVTPAADDAKAEIREPALRHPLFSKPEIVETTENKITFEPFHTVDYFASQGIKINQEIKSDDRLGKQMKSFTEWLKTMRKLPEASVEAELEKINDREIESIAAHSLEEKEVVTEAMAEVYAKQGLHAEASAVYHKLSLLNPGKSAYFAAKIEALKHQ